MLRSQRKEVFLVGGNAQLTVLRVIEGRAEKGPVFQQHGKPWAL